jgi:hypothetical protein
MTTPTEFFQPWEQELDSLDAFLALLRTEAFVLLPGDGRLFAWRGVVNADWALYSSLYRRLRWTDSTLKTETHLNAREADLVKDAHRWGVHYSGRSHLPVLYELRCNTSARRLG